MPYKELYIKPKTPKWHQFRMRGIGASEIAGVCSIYSDTLAQQTYTSGIKTHLEKIGEPITPFEGNIHTDSGKFDEPQIIKLYRHYDKTNEDPRHPYLNVEAGKKFNRVVRRKVYVVNEKYPFLFGSPDAIGYRNGKKYSVEAKATNSKDAAKYVNKVSPSFILQVMQILLITGWEYADICIRIDGKHVVVYTITPDKEWFDFILECSNKFWLNVLKAREIMMLYNINGYYHIHEDFMPEAWKTPLDELGGNSPVGILQSLEPDFTGSTVEEQFIKQHIIPRAEEISMELSSEQMLIIKEEYIPNHDLEQKYALKKNVAKHKLVKSLGGYNAATLPENESAYFSYKQDTRGSERFYVSEQLKKYLNQP